MKIGIYSPYFDTLGGGERYVLTFAEYCLQRGWEVELFWDDESVKDTAQERFNLKLDNLKFNKGMFRKLSADASYAEKFLKRLLMRSYDVVFYLSDGSIPTLHAKNNWLHFQVPFQISGQKFWTQQKLTNIQRVICNSKFTKKFIDKSFDIDSDVLYPPVAVHDFKMSQIDNESVILSVGRFDQIMNAKRQDVLLQAFKQLVDEGLQDWWLIFVGGSQHNQNELLKLREESIGYPVDFHVNIPYEELVSWYHRATIYWHGAGYGVDQDKDPDKVEHFGISIVEAMAAGCIPMVYPSGGVTEIIKDKKNGYYWRDVEQLVQMTKNTTFDIGKERDVIEEAHRSAERFGKEAFFTKLEEFFEGAR